MDSEAALPTQFLFFVSQLKPYQEEGEYPIASNMCTNIRLSLASVVCPL